MKIMNNFEIDYKKEIERLKKELNAVILAHYYQTPDIQDIADFVGDSLDLSRKAKETDADVIVFAGVHFMGETAKILNPNKKVLLPDLDAGCSLADSCPPGLFRKFREEHPGHIAITYINCTAAVKALSDIICTSSNAEKIVRQIPLEQPILFSPDRNLGAYLIRKTGRQMLLWEGSCIVHEAFNEAKITKLKELNPEAKIIAHPECEETLLSKADFIGSTSALLKFVQTDDAQCYIVATEIGIFHQMKKLVPAKRLIPAPPKDTPECEGCFNCRFMKLNTMEKLYNCMLNGAPEILIPEDIRIKALKPIEKMLEMS
jgi:quinolinate synthase